MIVTIDGPAGSGKSTVAKELAKQVGFQFLNTGAMYRATVLLALREGVDLGNGEALAILVRNHTIALATPQGSQIDGRKITVYLDDEDVSWEIRTESVSTAASKVSQHAMVREQLVPQQQEIARTHNVVMEGRDITFRVLPDAQLKIFLTASEDKRAGWRHEELMARGEETSLEQIKKDLKERDDRDMNRKVDPLHVAEDAWLFDRSEYVLEEVIDIIEKKAKELWQKSVQ